MADKFLNIIVSDQRLPEYIISNCDPCFFSHFWNELISLLDMTLTFSMNLHPQSDGMAEFSKPYYRAAIMNKCIIEKPGEKITTGSHAH